MPPGQAEFFHTVETFFPYHGKTAKIFSIPWKNQGNRLKAEDRKENRRGRIA